MFKNHPNVSKIQFIVIPQCREQLCTASEIPADYKEVVSKYAPNQPICEGVKFDFSWLLHYGEPTLWAIFSSTNIKK